ncbi:MAG: hypothetical protein Tsb0021_00390 [Chlamydiales bacterium]
MKTIVNGLIYFVLIFHLNGQDRDSDTYTHFIETLFAPSDSILENQRGWSLIVLPEDAQDENPLIPFIEQAKEADQIFMGAFKLQNPQPDILDALKNAVERGVIVHLLAEDRLTNMEIKVDNFEKKKAEAQHAYESIGVPVHFIKNANYDQTHVKYILLESKDSTTSDQKVEALIGNTNFDKNFFGKTNQRPSRDFSVRIQDKEIIKELKEGFWKDIKGERFQPTCVHQLIWGPEYQREKLKGMICSAKDYIRIYQQDLTDQEIIEALINAINKQVHVEVIMSPHPFGFDKPDLNLPSQHTIAMAGGKIYLHNHNTIHAKCLIVDDVAYIGSTNFFTPAIGIEDHQEQKWIGNRNVGILIYNPELIKKLNQIFDQDIRLSKIVETSTVTVK